MTTKHKTTFEKVRDLMAIYQGYLAELDHIADTGEGNEYVAQQRVRRTHQKLRKQMAKYLRETDGE